MSTTERLLLDKLVILRGLLDDPVVRATRVVLQADQGDLSALVNAYAELAHCLFESATPALRPYVANAAANDDNVYVRTILAGEVPARSLRTAVEADLRVLQEACDVVGALYASEVMGAVVLPAFDMGPAQNMVVAYHRHMAGLRSAGFGPFARHRSFALDAQGAPVAVRHPDPICLADLVGYAHEKDLILGNARAMLDGLPTANVLLVGDAGTGKSSMVRAVANELADEGLRLVEVRMSQLAHLPALLDDLAENPLSFVLLIDDLNLQTIGDDYAVLKDVLERAATASCPNVAVYATSTWWRLAGEGIAEHDGDDVPANDRLQEAVALVERFGMCVTFAKPSTDDYLEIVHMLVENRGLRLNGDALDEAAERFALEGGGRTARRARQFADALAAGSEEVLSNEILQAVQPLPEEAEAPAEEEPEEPVDGQLASGEPAGEAAAGEEPAEEPVADAPAEEAAGQGQPEEDEPAEEAGDEAQAADEDDSHDGLDEPEGAAPATDEHNEEPQAGPEPQAQPDGEPDDELQDHAADVAGPEEDERQDSPELSPEGTGEVLGLTPQTRKPTLVERLQQFLRS